MAFRLRRGTDAERQLITPVEGELIYVTDTKAIYVGDGTTVGGVLVTNESVINELSELNDVDSNMSPSSGDILSYDGTKWSTISGLDAGVREGSTYGINVSGSDSTILVNYDLSQLEGTLDGTLIGDVFAGDGVTKVIKHGTGNGDAVFYGTVQGRLDGEVNGSIFADDSSLLVDGISGRIVGPIDTDVTANIGPLALGEDLSGSAGQIRVNDATKTSLILTTANANGIVNSTQSMRVGTFTGSLDATVTAYTTSTTQPTYMVYHSAESADATSYSFLRSRGTKAAPTAVQSGDALGAFTATGWNSTAFKPAGGLRIVANDSPGANRIPSNIELFHYDGTGTIDVALSVKADTKTAEFSGPIKTAIYNNDADRDAAITSPEEGMIIFNKRDDSTGVPQFQGYDGTYWVDLH
jgi:hypothetical protein